MKNKHLLIIAIFGVIGCLILLRDFNSGPEELVISGENTHSLEAPMGAATDEKLVFIANGNKNQISVFNLKGEFQYPIGHEGQNDGEFQYPVDVEVHKGNIYVADLGNNRIQIFKKNGQFIDYFPIEQNIKPAAISIKNNQIYVSDIYSHTIKVFSITGEPIHSFAEYGSQDGQLNYANGLAVTDQGEIYVSDSQNQRIQLFNKNGSLLDVLKTSIKLGMARGMAIWGNNLYLADSNHKKVFVFDREGELVSEVKTETNLHAPTDIFVSKNYFVITDKGNNQVIVLKRGGK